MNDAAPLDTPPAFLKERSVRTVEKRSRIALLDFARGAALVAMIVYHGAWDLSFFRLADIDVNVGGWRIFARLIAGTFLFLSGLSLALATRNGIRWPAYLRRTLVIALAAAIVTVATYFVMGEGFVFFGILHQIALASLLAIPFLAAPAPLTAIAGAAVIGVPFFWRHEIFSAPILWWVGLAPMPPPSFDYVPVFPWFGIVLLGLACGRLIIRGGLDLRLTAVALPFPPFRWLGFAGRNSLAVYLIHQPVILGLLWVVTALAPVPMQSEADFRTECETSCSALGHPAATCGTYCGCIIEGLRDTGELGPALANRMTPAGQDRLRTVAGICRRDVVGDPPPDREIPPP